MTAEPDRADERGDPPDRTELRGEVDALRAENRRLRAEYARAKRTRYRRSGLALVAVGVVALAAGAAFPSSRTVLLALGGTGVFAGVLTYYLTPERVIAASVGERIFDAFAANGDAVVDELGLRDERVYVPTGADAGEVRLFVPQRAGYEIPAADRLDDVFVVPDDGGAARGVALRPTGGPLFAELARTLGEDLASDPAPLADQLADGLVEQFELAGGVRTEVDAAAGRLTLGVADSALGAVDRFDHPIPSLAASGLASGLGRPVTVEVHLADGDRVDYVVTCDWESDGRG